MHRTIETHPYHLRHAASVIAVGLVDLRLQHGPHVPGLDTDHRQARFGQSAIQPLRQRPSFKPNPFEVVGGVRQHRQQGLGLARHLHFPNDLAHLIYNADAGLLDRYVQSSKMVHAALLLLMLEATRTSFHHQPEAQHPKSSDIHKLTADYPIYRGRTGLVVLTLSLAASDPTRTLAGSKSR